MTPMLDGHQSIILNAKGDQKMYIGLYTVCLGSMPLKEKARWASQNGFSSIEIGCWPKVNDRDYSSCDVDVERLTQSAADGIKAYMKEYNLKLSSLAYYDNNLDHDPKKRAFINNHVKKCIDAAAMLGCDTVGTFVGRDIDRDMEGNFDEFETVFKDIVGYAEQKGIRIVIENCNMMGWQIKGLPGTISYTPELWEEMFSRVPNRNFGLNYDPSHMLPQMLDYIGVIPKFRDRIFHAHAKDAEVFADELKWYGTTDRQLPVKEGHRGGYWRYRMPGLGQVDWGRLISTLKENGYDGVISIEHEDPVYQGSEQKIKEGLILGREHLQKFIK